MIGKILSYLFVSRPVQTVEVAPRQVEALTTEDVSVTGTSIISKEATSEVLSSTPSKESETSSVNITSRCLPRTKANNYNIAHQWIQAMHKEFPSDLDSYSGEQLSVMSKVTDVLSASLHISSLPSDEKMLLASNDVKAIIGLIRRLKQKTGLSELAVMILMSIIVKKRLYRKIGCRSDSDFFRQNAEEMGISSSRARDYAHRGNAFLKYRQDFLEGIGDISGIPLNDFATSHMSKLPLYEKAVKKFGREEAFSRFKNSTFRTFQEMLIERPSKNLKKKKTKVPSLSVSDESGGIHKAQKQWILEQNLSPEEKRGLRIIAKGGKYCLTVGLTDDQALEVERRLRQHRIEITEKNLKRDTHIGLIRKSYDPENPLAISNDIFDLNNINDIILRIRAGLALLVPARRTIAILTYRLKSEKLYEKSSSVLGVRYTNFRDFAMNELGMGEEYRDYCRVGEVLHKYYFFLDHISDMDTEEMFFKLRYLPDALITHNGDELLVLARLRSLSTREFRLFSIDPDFEITFSKRLTKKQLGLFNDLLIRTRDPYKMCGDYPVNFIEVYNINEYGTVDNIVWDVIEESGGKRGVPPSLTELSSYKSPD